MQIEDDKKIDLTEVEEKDDSAESSIAEPLPNLGEQFQVEELIGMGAMGSVYRAIDEQVDQPVAVKVLKPELARDAVAVKRFEQEVEAASKLDHSNLVSVYRHGKSPSGLPFLTMDLLEGGNLSDLIKKSGVLSEERVLKIVLQICDALEHAHSKGVIHRDLKPSNVVVAEEDFVKVADFGIAKVASTTSGETGSLTGTGDIIGSPYYMSPEQCKGEDLDESSDLYSLACLMVEALTGKPPYDGINSVQIILGHLNEPLTEVKSRLEIKQVSKSLCEVILVCLSKTKQGRYRTVKMLAQDLRAIAGGRQPLNCNALKVETKNPLAVGLIYGFSAFLVLGLFGAFMLQSINYFSPNSIPSIGVKPKLANMKSSAIRDRDIQYASMADRMARYLDLKNAMITDRALTYLRSFPNLTFLTLSGTRITDQGLSSLSGIPNIKSIKLDRTRITDAGLENLILMPSLERLYLKGTHVTDQGLSSLAQIDKLTNLCLTETQVSDQGLKKLETLPLKSLHLVSTRVSDKGLKSVAKISTLETLRLTKSPITGPGLIELVKLNNLKYLNLDKTDLTDKYLTPLAALPNLSSLRLNNTKITDKALNTVGKISSLQTLKLQSTEIGDSNISALANLKQLRILDLTRTHVSDKALDAISKFPSLEVLRLSNTKVTSKGILKLAASPKLKQVFLKGCDLVSPQSMQELEMLKPGLKVE